MTYEKLYEELSKHGEVKLTMLPERYVETSFYSSCWWDTIRQLVKLNKHPIITAYLCPEDGIMLSFPKEGILGTFFADAELDDEEEYCFEMYEDTKLDIELLI